MFLVVVFIGVIFMLNLKVSTKQGINFHVVVKSIPFYVKICGFISRDYEYKQIVKSLLGKVISDEDKARLLFVWTHNNVRPIPQGFPIVDDHISNIIIRGYGTSDQAADVFCNLCEYAGLPAKWAFLRLPNTHNDIVLSFVYIYGKWRVFDAYNNNIFTTMENKLASKEDIINDLSLVDRVQYKPIVDGTEYREFFRSLHTLEEKDMWRRGKDQMLLSRLTQEIKNKLLNR